MGGLPAKSIIFLADIFNLLLRNKFNIEGWGNIISFPD